MWIFPRVTADWPAPDNPTSPCTEDLNSLAQTELGFREANLGILCNILSAINGGSGNAFYSWKVLCDPSSGEPVLVRLVYDADGVPADISGFTLDGAAYTGDVTALVACGGSTTATDVNVLTLPAISGTVAVNNFPAIYDVSGSIVDVTGSSITISNFPATQPVSGSVSVSNFPATQPVSGSVSVSNFPASFGVTQDTSPWVISAIDLDIRDLSNVTDSVEAFQGGAWTITTTPDPSGAANIITGVVTVDDTAGGTLIAAARPTRRRITIVLTGTDDVWIGESPLAIATNGIPLYGNPGNSRTIDTKAAVYGIMDTGLSQGVRYIEEYD